jgi:LAO/AO transport system kinase
MDATLEQLVADAGRPGVAQARAAAKLMTLLSNEPQRLPQLFEGMTRWPQPRLVLGVTGAPGSGKSTLSDHLVAEFRRRHPDSRVGVLAVDPSSPFTGGAVLGDRVRMMRHATDPNVFIRSLATRGHLGGLTLGVRGMLRVMGLIGCDLVLLETVGVGQSEVEVAGVADLVMVVLAPGQGDSVQMLKAGLMEVGDIFAINKADRPGAAMLFAQLVSVLRMDEPPIDPDSAPGSAGGPRHETLPRPLPGREEGEAAARYATTVTHHACVEPELLAAGDVVRHVGKAAVVLTAANDHQGVPELMDLLERRMAEGAEQWRQRRVTMLADEIRESVLAEVRQRTEGALGRNGAGAEALQRILRGQSSVAELAQQLIDALAREAE